MNKQQLILAGALVLLSCGESHEEKFLDEIHHEFDSLNNDMMRLELTLQHTTNDSVRSIIIERGRFDNDEMQDIIQTELRMSEH